jgi:protoporphyrinogen IX oxidase
MLSVSTLLVSVHVVANLVWIGSIIATAVALVTPGVALDTRGTIAFQVYRRVAAPAFGLSFVTGLIRLALDTHYFLVTTKYMHAKLLFALVVIALHHVIGARAKRAAAPESKEPGNVAVLCVGLLVCATAAAFLVLLKPF